MAYYIRHIIFLGAADAVIAFVFTLAQNTKRMLMYTRHFISLIITSLFILSASAQQGDALTKPIGKAPGSEEAKQLILTYNLSMANNERYLGKEGIELIFKKDALNEIKLYGNSDVYGSFKSELPHKLSFGMTDAAVKQLLGKPTVAYNTNGYIEYQKDTYVLSCWFEGGKLNQVVIAAKE